MIDLFQWIEGVEAKDLPSVPFLLYPATTVLDTAKWLETVKYDVRNREGSYRCKTGVLHKDLRRIRELYAIQFEAISGKSESQHFEQMGIWD